MRRPYEHLSFAKTVTVRVDVEDEPEFLFVLNAKGAYFFLGSLQGFGVGGGGVVGFGDVICSGCVAGDAEQYTFWPMLFDLKFQVFQMRTARSSLLLHVLNIE